MAQEPKIQALVHQDERNRPQILEEHEVRQEAQCESQPTVEARHQERC